MANRPSNTQVDGAQDGFTFPVHDVLTEVNRLPKSRVHSHVARMLSRGLESCSDYHTEICERLNYQPLLAAVYTAYSLHLPLKLTPDAVWLTIAQGIAQHMAINGETLRDRFVSHSGKMTLTVLVDGWIAQSPENPWDEAMEGWTEQIKDHVGDSIYDCLRCNFSTTNRSSYVASLIVMMDIFQTYFKYEMRGICGIPSVSLIGTTEDWDGLAAKVSHLRRFEIDWWIDTLLPLVEEMAAARKGNVNLNHWRNICKLEDAYGGSEINGWIACFFPYLREMAQGPCKKRNPIFETGRGFQTFSAPSGLSKVEFVWQQDGSRRLMNAVGGLIGVKQDPTTLALEPIAGWAICEASELDALFDAVRSQMDGSTIETSMIDAVAAPRSNENSPPNGSYDFERDLPQDLGRFLAEFPDETRITPLGSLESILFLPLSIRSGIDWGEEQPNSRGPGGLTWFCVAELSSGRRLAINLDVNRHLSRGCRNMSESHDLHDANPICLITGETQGVAGENPVVAMSFTELLRKLTQKSDSPSFYWDQPGFIAYGDATEFTRMQTFESEMADRPERKKGKNKRRP